MVLSGALQTDGRLEKTGELASLDTSKHAKSGGAQLATRTQSLLIAHARLVSRQITRRNQLA